VSSFFLFGFLMGCLMFNQASTILKMKALKSNFMTFLYLDFVCLLKSPLIMLWKQESFFKRGVDRWLDPGTGKQGRDCFLMGKFRDFVICEFFWFVWLQRWTSWMWVRWRRKLCHGKKYVFYGLFDEFGLFSFCELAECDEVRWRRKLCHGKNMTGNRFIMVCLNSMEKNTEKHRVLFGPDTTN
jgi:hypothetical protein